MILQLGSTSQIGLVVPGVSNPFFAWLTDRIEARARSLATVVMNSAVSGVLEVVTRFKIPDTAEHLRQRVVHAALEGFGGVGDVARPDE